MNKKNLIFMMLALMVATLTFTSCSSDEDDLDPLDPNNLIGTWKAIGDSNDNGNSWRYYEDRVYYQFQKGGYLYQKNIGSNYQSHEYYLWELVDNNLILREGTKIFVTYTVESVSKNTLVLKYYSSGYYYLFKFVKVSDSEIK